MRVHLMRAGQEATLADALRGRTVRIFAADPVQRMRARRLFAGSESLDLTCDALAQRELIRDAAALVASVAGRDADLRWWATDFASRNRFLCELPQWLALLEAVRGERGRADDVDLVIVHPPEGLAPLLRGMGHEVNVGRPAGRAARVWDGVRRRLGLWRSVAGTFAKFMVKWTAERIVLGRAHRQAMSRGGVGAERGAGAYVVKSFFYPHSFDAQGRYRDMFFGALPEEAMARGQRVVVVGVAVTGFWAVLRSMKSRRSPYPVVPLEMFASPWRVARDLARLALWGGPRVDQAVFRGLDVTELVRAMSRPSAATIQLMQYLHYEWTRGFCGRTAVNVWAQTCEHNPWERMTVAALRRWAPEATLLGHPHAVIPPASLNMFPAAGEDDAAVFVDRIVTTGPHPTKLLRQLGGYQRTEIATGCGLRFTMPARSEGGDSRRAGRVLVALEGVPQAAMLALRAVRELGGVAGVTVRLRSHPSYSLERMKLDVPELAGAEAQAEVSSGKSLKDDLAWADVVLYWGTTVALEAMAMGRPVVHVPMGDPLSYDPLSDCGFLHWTAGSGPLTGVLDAIRSLDSREMEQQVQGAREYLAGYFAPVSDEGLSAFFPPAGKPRGNWRP